MKPRGPIFVVLCVAAAVMWVIPTDLRAYWQFAFGFGVALAGGLIARSVHSALGHTAIVGVCAGLAKLTLIVFYKPPLPPAGANEIVVYRIYNWPSAILALIAAMALTLLVDLVAMRLLRSRKS
jgi:hypothetical protein